MNRRRRHLLIDIIVIAFCAVIGGAETWKDVQIWAESHHNWLAKFLVESRFIWPPGPRPDPA